MGLFEIKDLCQQSLNHALQEEIKRCINEIQSQLCRKIMKNFDERVRIYQQSRGDHLPDMLFHK